MLSQKGQRYHAFKAILPDIVLTCAPVAPARAPRPGPSLCVVLQCTPGLHNKIPALKTFARG